MGNPIDYKQANQNFEALKTVLKDIGDGIELYANDNEAKKDMLLGVVSTFDCYFPINDRFEKYDELELLVSRSTLLFGGLFSDYFPDNRELSGRILMAHDIVLAIYFFLYRFSVKGIHGFYAMYSGFKDDLCSFEGVVSDHSIVVLDGVVSSCVQSLESQVNNSVDNYLLNNMVNAMSIRDQLSKKIDESNDAVNRIVGRYYDIKGSLDIIESKISERDNKAEDSISKLELFLDDKKNVIDRKLDKAVSDVIEEFREKNDSYEKDLDRLMDKAKKSSSLIAEQALSNSYDNNAQIERKSANNMRIGAIAFMVCIAIVAGWSFYQSVHDALKVDQALIRMSLVFILSIPAVYLSRESTKHRLQSYSYEQTSLDLKALDPFIGTLDKAEQDKIKTEMANRIFASRDFNPVAQDSSPVNPQELIMAMLEKFPTLSTENKKADKAEATAKPNPNPNPTQPAVEKKEEETV